MRIFFLFLLVVIGATGILEQQTRRIVTYASIGVGLLAICGMTVGARFIQICCEKGKIETNFTPNKPRRMQQQISNSALSRDAIFDEIEPLLGDTEAIPKY